jgi:hypothetical protein
MSRKQTTASRSAILAIGLLNTLGCSQDEAVTRPAVTFEALGAAVTDEVATRISGNTFVLDPPSDPRPLLTEGRARLLAELAGRQHGHMLAKDLVRQHEGPIDFSRLTSCGPAYYARSPFEAIPQTRDEVVYYLGSYWLVALCDAANVPAVSVAVAATATGTRIVNGRVLPEPNSLRMVGIPPTWRGALPLSPEEAAILAAESTDRRVAAVPVLYAPNPLDAFPQGAVWVVELNAEVSLRGATTAATYSRGRVIVTSAPVAQDAMRRGGLGVYAERPGGRRSLRLPDSWGEFSALMMSVDSRAALDIERVAIATGGH